MFYPDYHVGMAHHEDRIRSKYKLRNLKRDPRLPSRWDLVLLRLGNTLIVLGQKVRSESAYAKCCEAKTLQVKPTGGRA